MVPAEQFSEAMRPDQPQKVEKKLTPEEAIGKLNTLSEHKGKSLDDVKAEVRAILERTDVPAKMKTKFAAEVQPIIFKTYRATQEFVDGKLSEQDIAAIHTDTLKKIDQQIS